jgi:Tfp pilus assembly protein PilN
VAQSLTTLVEIDFLPLSYRQRSVNRRAHIWRVASGMAIAGCFAATALWQRGHFAQVSFELAEIEGQYLDAAAKNAKLAEITAKLRDERTTAELLTYLRHRWPQTQIMAAILDPLPDSIVLTEWHTGQETIPTTTAPTVALAEAKEAPSNKPARRASDLKRLLREGAMQQHVVALSGRAADSAALHEYLARLGTNSLFSRVDLQSLEHAPSDKDSGAGLGTIHFAARAILRPGHGQSSPPASTPPTPVATQAPLARRGEPQ